MLQLPPQPPLLLDQTPSGVQRLPASLVHRIEAHHALALFVVKVLVLAVVVVDVDCVLASPGRGCEEGVEGVGELGAPVCCLLGEGGGHGEVLAVAGAVAADEGENEEGCGEVEKEGYEEGGEDALGWWLAWYMEGVVAGVVEASSWVRVSYPKEVGEACHSADPLREMSRCLTGVCRFRARAEGLLGVLWVMGFRTLTQPGAEAGVSSS